MTKFALILGFSALFLAPQAHADSVLTFDDIPDGGIVTNQYNGVTITGASVLTEDSSLNPAFPPFSDPKVVYDYLDGTITLDFTTSVDSIGAYVTGNVPITLSAYDGTTLLGTVATPGANFLGAGLGFDPNIFISLAFPTITSAIFTNGEGFGNTFTLDNVTIGGDVTVNGVPEPASWALMIAGIGMVGAGLRGRRTMSVRYA